MESVHNKLRRMESLLSAIPQEIQVLYKFKVIHTENDFVGIKFHTSEHCYVGCSADAPLEIKVHPTLRWVEVCAPHINITLYGSTSIPMSHTDILGNP